MEGGIREKPADARWDRTDGEAVKLGDRGLGLGWIGRLARTEYSVGGYFLPVPCNATYGYCPPRKYTYLWVAIVERPATHYDHSREKKIGGAGAGGRPCSAASAGVLCCWLRAAWMERYGGLLNQICGLVPVR